MISVWLLLLPLVVASEGLKGFNTISHSDLVKQGQDRRQFFINSLTVDGILEINNVPQLAEARRSAFSAVDLCMRKSHPFKYLDENSEPSLTSETLGDGTYRQSIGTQVKPGNVHAQISPALINTCPELDDALENLRVIVDKVSSHLMFALDEALLPQENGKVGAPLFYDRAFDTSGGYDYMLTASTEHPFRKYPGTFWKGFAESTQGATQLEHFHTYTPPSSTPVKNALDFHTDAGLFLLFVPAWYSEDPLDLKLTHSAASPLAADFKYLDRNGHERTIMVQGSSAGALWHDLATTDVVGDASLMMMVGKGAEQFLTPGLRGLKMRAVPHALTMAQASPRFWYGRMFLPPATAYLEDYKMSYGDLRSHMIAQSRDPLARAAAARGDSVVYTLTLPAGSPLGVSIAGLPTAQALRTPLVIDEKSHQENNELLDYPTYASLRTGIKVMDSCLAGQIWCWHTCEDIAAYNLTCPTSEVTCVGPDGQPADPDLHVPANHPGCVGSVYVDPGGFCQGSTGVSMYMEGFISYVTGEYRTEGGSKTPSCLVLWFPDWILDTQGKFAAACMGVFLLGIFTEFLSYLRRLVRTHVKTLSPPPQIFSMCFLYAVQLMFGYFCMLIAMTYQVELFVCVVVGIGTGHALFNFKPYLPNPNDGKNTSFSDKDKGFNGLSNSRKEDEEEVVDPCCQYLAMEEDSTHALNDNNSNKGNKNNGNVTNPLDRKSVV